MKQRVNLQQLSRNIVPKAVLLTKSIQMKIDFDTKVTAWIPEAQQNRPMPQICVTLNAAHDELRLNANSTEEIINYFGQVIHHLESNRDILDSRITKEQGKWLEICQETFNRAKGTAIIPLHKVSA